MPRGPLSHNPSMSAVSSDISAYSGEQYRPAKRMLRVGLCRMKKRKGWSALKVSVITAERSLMTAPVAAADSVPSSLTSTKALWMTFVRTRSLAGDMPVSERKKSPSLYHMLKQ